MRASNLVDDQVAFFSCIESFHVGIDILYNNSQHIATPERKQKPSIKQNQEKTLFPTEKRVMKRPSEFFYF